MAAQRAFPTTPLWLVIGQERQPDLCAWRQRRVQAAAGHPFELDQTANSDKMSRERCLRHDLSPQNSESATDVDDASFPSASQEEGENGCDKRDGWRSNMRPGTIFSLVDWLSTTGVMHRNHPSDTKGRRHQQQRRHW
jgi:hypothetical protein